MKKLDVPYHEQESRHTCGPASLRMVFSYFDELYGETQLARKTKTSWREGTRHRYMISVARGAGFWVYNNIDSTLAELKWFINHELPVIVNFFEPSEDVAHYAVATGYDAKGILLNDPWNGKDFHLARRTFLGRWRSWEGRKKRWLMVVGRSDFRPQPYGNGEELLTGSFYDPF